MHATEWRTAPGRTLDLGTPTLMGILNVTPDSFSDGGRFDCVDAAATHAAAMIAAGAGIIDVGGESTRPGASRVDAAAQIDRVIPVIEAVRERSECLISIDTTIAAVADAALAAGATIINDVSACMEDAAMLPLAANAGCGVVLMHRLLPPDRDRWSTNWTTPPDYEGDVVGAVRKWLEARADAAVAAGVEREAICLDPGLGFGKSVLQNWQLVAGSDRLCGSGYPVLGAASRKSWVGAVTGAGLPEKRLEGSLAAAAAMLAGGVQLLRVHDVEPHRVMVDAMMKGPVQAGQP
ncbi:MAG: dihydropteroate synthase [Phycisphaerales bacterium]|jgi:dihydropteroate synthase|nr:dihydropteroate synthase [Phycisphaerales bacterium]